MSKTRNKLQEMRDKGMKWSEISRNCMMSKARVQAIHEGVAMPTPQEERDIEMVKV